jgi:arylsulfatase A-like enzyme
VLKVNFTSFITLADKSQEQHTSSYNSRLDKAFLYSLFMLDTHLNERISSMVNRPFHGNHKSTTRLKKSNTGEAPRMENKKAQTDRRTFIKSALSAAALANTAATARANDRTSTEGSSDNARKKPNIVLYVADQVRWDFIGAYGLNPSVRTPNLDRLVQRGTAFTHAVTNQPLCSPSRACMITGRYATETGMWQLELELRRDLPTLATVLRSNGYTANFIGKWHLALIPPGDEKARGYVPPESRGGFLDFWEGANALELTSHPYAGTIWDGQGNAITFQDQYRVDFVTDRAVRFLRQPQEKPFLLFISQLEPHHQNDEKRFVAPRGYAERYENPYVPPDLLHLPGDWQKQLPDYYGSIERIDESVGRILQTLEEQNLLENTIFLFTSDHGCHFRTRNGEYKRSPHDSSIRIPFLMQGPGVERSLRLNQIIGNISLTPTLLELCGVAAPSSMKGRSLAPLIRSSEARAKWQNEALIQISQSMVARAIRTDEWTYCVANPALDGKKVPSSQTYSEYQMYNNFGDPAQLVNLAGRFPYRKTADALRERLLELIAASGEERPEILPARLYP